MVDPRIPATSLAEQVRNGDAKARELHTHEPWRLRCRRIPNPECPLVNDATSPATPSATPPVNLLRDRQTESLAFDECFVSQWINVRRNPDGARSNLVSEDGIAEAPELKRSHASVTVRLHPGSSGSYGGGGWP